MRTTLELDDDILASAKDIARREGKTAGRVISELTRRALTQGLHVKAAPARTSKTGFSPFPSRGSVVTNEAIDRLRDEDEY